jgi:hypothetical protein
MDGVIEEVTLFHRCTPAQASCRNSRLTPESRGCYNERDLSITVVDVAFPTKRSRHDDAKSILPQFCGGLGCK